MAVNAFSPPDKSEMLSSFFFLTAGQYQFLTPAMFSSISTSEVLSPPKKDLNTSLKVSLRVLKVLRNISFVVLFILLMPCKSSMDSC